MTELEKLETLVYHGFKEIDRRFVESNQQFQEQLTKLAEKQQETARQLQQTNGLVFESSGQVGQLSEHIGQLSEHIREVTQKFEITDQKMREMVRQSEITDQKIRELTQQIDRADRQILETDRLVKEMARRSEVTDQKLQDLIKRFAGLTDSLGLFAESSVRPAVARVFRERGFQLTNISARSVGRLNGDGMEWDVLGYGPTHVLAVEVKLKLERRDVDETLERLPRFFDFFLRYRGLVLHGAVAGMSIDEGVDRYAYKSGLFVLTQSGENIVLLNSADFVPRAYTYSATQS
ncbi:MAG: hypothetical protein DKINENOH_02843 [bacterium]|nr:hypothetical protein [bacterium]